MIVPLQEMLKDAEARNYAIPSINTPNQISLRAVIAAAEDTGVPVTLNHAQTENDHIPIEIAFPLMSEYAKNSKAALAVHVDHGYDLTHCMKAVRLGATSIMYDCSRFPLEENIRRVKEFTELVHPLGIAIEAELGAMPNNMPDDVHGQEKSDLSDLSKYFTDPAEAERFCREAGCDVLTVSFGTVHGMYAGEPNLRLPLVEEIRKRARGVALGMHGASGTPFDQIQGAINAGIRKINYFTAIDTAPAPVLRDYIEASTLPVNFYKLADMAMEVIYSKTVEFLNVCKSCMK